MEYGIDKLYNVRQERKLFPNDAPVVGSCVASTLNISVIPQGQVPRMAEINLYVRLVSPDGTDTSEWIPGGTYFIDTRSKASDGTSLTFTAYDAMLKAGQTYLDVTAFDDWPQTDIDVVDEIASLMGLTVDPRTELKGYNVPYPSDWTMTEILEYIAASHAGNWTVTPNNQLRLVKLGKDVTALGKDYEKGILFGDSVIVLSTGYDYDMNRSVLGADDESGIQFGDTAVVLDSDILRSEMAKNNIYRNAQDFKNLGRQEAYSGVKVWWSREDTYEEEAGERVAVENAYEAGDDAGRVLELDCPWATQAMADAIFAEVEGYAYQGADVTGAEITPAAEIGDIVVCDGVVFDMAKYDVSYSGGYYPHISAPSEEEVDSEYKYISKTERELTRRVKLGETYFGFRTSRENGIEVVNIENGVETTRMVLNSNVQAFYNANGAEALYFDPVAGKYKFVGDVTITSGSLNINNNFIVDTNGNVTTNGSVTLQGANTVIYSPKIFASSFAVFPLNLPSGTQIPTPPDGFNLYSFVDNQLYNFLRISQYDIYTRFESVAGGDAAWNFGSTDVNGTLHLRGTTYYKPSSGTPTASDIVATIGDIPDVSGFVTASQVQDMIDAAIGGT